MGTRGGGFRKSTAQLVLLRDGQALTHGGQQQGGGGMILTSGGGEGQRHWGQVVLLFSRSFTLPLQNVDGGSVSQTKALCQAWIVALYPQVKGSHKDWMRLHTWEAKWPCQARILPDDQGLRAFWPKNIPVHAKRGPARYPFLLVHILEAQKHLDPAEGPWWSDKS